MTDSDGLGHRASAGTLARETRKGFSEALSSVLRDKMAPERESHWTWQLRGSRMRPTCVCGVGLGGTGRMACVAS